MISRHFPLPDYKQAQNHLENIFSSPVAVPPSDNDKNVILYGAGNLGKMACEFLDYVKVEILFAYDRAAKTGDMLCDSIPVFPPDKPGKFGDNLILVSTLSVPFTEIENFLLSLGWKRILPFYDYALQFSNIHPLNNGWFSGPLSSEDKDKIYEVLSNLGDRHSYAAYLQFLAWRVLREDWIFEDAPVRMHDRYFIDPVREILTDHEIFFDIGAHEGEVFSRFLHETGDKFKAAYLFEPDKKNYFNLKNYIDSLPEGVQEKVFLFNKSVGKYHQTANFAHLFGFTSRLWQGGDGKSEVVKLDEFKVTVSFIKMHIEGSELAALNGGLTLLMKTKPIIVTTIYHNRDGLWKIGILMNSILTKYTFLFRIHSWCGTGVVIYMLPNMRF
jgi:FkbM family methyltransferase